MIFRSYLQLFDGPVFNWKGPKMTQVQMELLPASKRVCMSLPHHHLRFEWAAMVAFDRDLSDPQFLILYSCPQCQENHNVNIRCCNARSENVWNSDGCIFPTSNGKEMKSSMVKEQRINENQPHQTNINVIKLWSTNFRTHGNYFRSAQKKSAVLQLLSPSESMRPTNREQWCKTAVAKHFFCKTFLPGTNKSQFHPCSLSFKKTPADSLTWKGLDISIWDGETEASALSMFGAGEQDWLRNSSWLLPVIIELKQFIWGRFSNTLWLGARLRMERVDLGNLLYLATKCWTLIVGQHVNALYKPRRAGELNGKCLWKNLERCGMRMHTPQVCLPILSTGNFKN